MEEKLNTFEITPVIDESTGKYVIKNFDLVREGCQAFIKENGYQDLVITNDSDYKLIADGRTVIRKKIDAIASARKNVNELVLGEFNTQLKELEKMLKEADDLSKEKVHTFDEEVKGKVLKPRIITLTVKNYDSKVIEKVKAYATKLGCAAEVK